MEIAGLMSSLRGEGDGSRKSFPAHEPARLHAHARDWLQGEGMTTAEYQAVASIGTARTANSMPGQGIVPVHTSTGNGTCRIRLDQSHYLRPRRLRWRSLAERYRAAVELPGCDDH